jgi:hypothetical protein
MNLIWALATTTTIILGGLMIRFIMLRTNFNLTIEFSTRIVLLVRSKHYRLVSLIS